MSFGRKGRKNREHRPRSPNRPINVVQVIGAPSLAPKKNRMFGSGIFFVAALLVGGFGIWVDRNNNFYYNKGIPVVGDVVGNRTVSGSGASSGRITRLYDLRVRHPEFGPVSLELANPKNPAPLPDGTNASDARVLVLLHPSDPEAGKIASAEGPNSPLFITTIMALGFFLFATLNLFSEHRLIGSKRSRLRKD